ncbi:MAG TPA: hypothetical protein VGM23_01500, partial [Armatimonadota bacterium]
MKQCAACGKVYEATRFVCPGCFNKTWVPALAEGTVAALPRAPYPCPECGRLVETGTGKCPDCGQALIPISLRAVCLLAIIGFLVGLGNNAYLLVQAPGHQILLELFRVPDILLCVFGLPTAWSLLRGSYGAWVIARRLLIASLVTEVLVLIVAQLLQALPQPIFNDVVLSQITAAHALSLVCRFIAGAALWLYLSHDSVTDYASAGKPE